MGDDQVAAEIKPLKKHKIQVNSFQIPTMDLIDCDTKEEVLTSVLVVEEVTDNL